MTTPFAAGRTADVFPDAPGRVRRVYRDGRDASAEADLMRYVAGHGFPTPEVFDADGPTIVMAEVRGPTLAADAFAHPERTAAHATLLRDLHDRLAAVPPPPGLPSPFGPGDALLHLDLHPFNVLLGADGPVVIDWCTAAAGPGAVERAQTWMLLTTSVNPVPDLPADAFDRAGTTFAAALLDGDEDPARGWVAAVARHRLTDPFVLPAEREPLRRLGRIAQR